MWGDDELVPILRCLPQADRLGSCSLVSKQFRRAAARASNTITVSAAALTTTNSKTWIKQYGKHVSGLQVLGPLDPSSGTCQQRSTPAKVPLPLGILQLLPNVKTLQLPGSTAAQCGDDGAAVQYVAGRLEVSTPMTVSTAFWQHLNQFSGLEALHVPVHRDSPSSLYEPLPLQVCKAPLQLKQLKRLSLGAPSFMLSSDTTPQLGQLTSLEQLSLIFRSLQPELLASLTQLADLRLVGRLDNGNAPDNAALFEVLSGMNHLTRLHLEVDGGLDAISDGDCKATQVLVEQSDWYSAVTSSSKLQHLHLDMPLPQAAWKEMFHTDLQLPELKTLHANGYPGTHEGVLFDSDHMPGLIHLTVLQSLCLRWLIPDPNALLALPQLRNLRLHLKSAYLGDLNIARADVFYQVLPQLQHLTSLQYDLTSDPRPWCNDPPYAFSWPPVDPDVYTWRRMQHLQLGLPNFCGGFWRRLFAQGLLQHLGSPPGGCCSNNLPPSVLGKVTLVNSFHSALKVGYMSREGLTTLAAECPSLRNLYFGVDPSAGVDLSVLSQLRGLTELAISNVDPTAVGDLAAACSRVKGLKVLYLWFHGRCCADQCRADLTPLTSLTQLTRLTAGCYCMAAASNSSLLSLLSSMTASKVPGLLYEATGPTEAAWAPPVWRQLMRHCKGLSVSQCYEDIIDSMNYCSDQLQYFAQLTFGHLWS